MIATLSTAIAMPATPASAEDQALLGLVSEIGNMRRGVYVKVVCDSTVVRSERTRG